MDRKDGLIIAFFAALLILAVLSGCTKTADAPSTDTGGVSQGEQSTKTLDGFTIDFESAPEIHRIIYLTPEDYSILESLSLNFTPICSENEEIEIYINKRLVYNDMLGCGNMSEFSVRARTLQAGENGVAFIMRYGSATISDINVGMELGEKIIYPSYTFDVNRNTPNQTMINTKIMLALNPGSPSKAGKIVIGPYSFPFLGDHEEDITKGLGFGSNAVEIRPVGADMDIDRLCIEGAISRCWDNIHIEYKP